MGFLDYLDEHEEKNIDEVSISEARKILDEAREQYLDETKTEFTPAMITKLISESDNAEVIDALEQFRESFGLDALKKYGLDKKDKGPALGSPEMKRKVEQEDRMLENELGELLMLFDIEPHDVLDGAFLNPTAIEHAVGSMDKFYEALNVVLRGINKGVDLK